MYEVNGMNRVMVIDAGDTQKPLTNFQYAMNLLMFILSFTVPQHD